jgi:hypothetical protein
MAAIEPLATAAAASEEPKIIDKTIDKPIETAKVIEMPKPVEAVMKAAAEMKEAEKTPVAPLEELTAVASTARPIADEPRSNRFAMLAASVAFAGALGAMAGALGTSVFARPQPAAAAETPMATVDLTAVRDTMTSLRTELGAIKASVDSSNRNANAQFAKFNERLERIDRAQAAPSAQLKQAMEAIDRLEKRVQAQAGETTGSVRPQQTAVAVPSPATAAAAAAEASRARVIDGWTVRRVNRGVAVIQGRVGAIEVEAGDVVPGVGRIESIRRQEGRWVVLTSNGVITAPTPR